MLNDTFLTGKSIIAVIGVSLDETKYGHKVFFDLVNKGYKAYAVHPDGGKINGIQRYTSLSNVPKKPDLVVSVVKPEISEKIILECKKLGINKIWFQPGSENNEAIKLCDENHIKCLVNACIIIKSQKMGLK